MDDEMLETLPKQHVARFALSTFPSFSYRRGTLASASFCCCVARAYPLAPVGSDARASADGKPPGPLYKSPDAPAKRPHKTIRTSILREHAKVRAPTWRRLDLCFGRQQPRNDSWCALRFWGFVASTSSS
jgi:hypothetical protein